jgi:hypothetical protein
VRHAGRRGGVRHVVGHDQGSLVVDEREVQHDGVDVGIRGVQGRAVEEVYPHAAAERPDLVTGRAETGGGRRTL